MLRILITAFALLAVSYGVYAAPSDFTGTKSCATCHGEQHESWQNSHHDLAMQHASKDTVLGDFNGAEFSANGVSSRFFIKNGQYWVSTDAADGSIKGFEIRYTFGVTPLQQYLIEFPDGRVQALGIAWDARSASLGGQRWFHLYPDESIKAGDELHWTGPQQNWNYMCAGCHSTNLKKNYDSVNNTFKTSWTDIDVGCESCHGPGGQHLQWAAQNEQLRQQDPNRGLALLLRDRQDVRWIMNPETGIARREPPAGNNHEIGVCAACHSRRGLLKTGIESDGLFLDHYRPALLSAGLYHPDGQILDEVFVWGSFMQSRMQVAGVTCSDCHESHSLELRAAQDQVCSQCHLPTQYASTAHHQHAPKSTGARCLDCHMPANNYMVVDPRRDHSLRIPRPDLSLEFATPNACNQCHTDRSTAWAAEQFKRLWPGARQPYQNYTDAFSLARSGAPQSELALIKIARDSQLPDLVRATAAFELQAFLSPLSGAALQVALADQSPLVRYAALGSLEALPPENRYQFAAKLLSDPVRLVRVEAARISAPALRSQLRAAEKNVLQSALQEFIDAQNVNAERPESQLNLGNMYAQTGAGVEAEKAFRKALKLDSKFVPAYANLADLYRSQGQDQFAGKILEQGLVAVPDNATLYHATGLLMVRRRQLGTALPALKKAAELQPDSARYTYVYGVALSSTGQSEAALQVLQQGLVLHPHNREILQILASINRDLGRHSKAIVWAQKLLEINSADPFALQLIEALNNAQQHPQP